MGIHEKIKKKYCYMGKLTEGRIAVGNKPNKKSKDLMFGFIDESGKEIIPLKYDVVWNFYKGIARTKIEVNKRPNWGLIDRKGLEILPNIYKIILPLDNDLFYVQTMEEGFELKWSAFNLVSGEFIQTFLYDWLYPVKEDIIVYRIEAMFGAIHQGGKEIIPAIYECLKFFSQGLCAAKKDGKWGYINKENEVVIPFVYDLVWPFENGMAQVYKDSKYSVLELNEK